MLPRDVGEEEVERSEQQNDGSNSRIADGDHENEEVLRVLIRKVDTVGIDHVSDFIVGLGKVLELQIGYDEAGKAR